MQWYLQNIKGASARGELWGLLLFTAEWDASQKRKKKDIPPFLWSYLITHILSGALHATSCFMHNLWLLQSIFSITTCNAEVPHFQQSNYCTESVLQPLIMQQIIYLYVCWVWWFTRQILVGPPSELLSGQWTNCLQNTIFTFTGPAITPELFDNVK